MILFQWMEMHMLLMCLSGQEEYNNTSVILNTKICGFLRYLGNAKSHFLLVQNASMCYTKKQCTVPITAFRVLEVKLKNYYAT